MAFSARVILDSLSPVHGIRLTTVEVCFPRIILAEVNTHRQLSRNSASSRAIPISKMIKRAQDDPFVPLQWPRNGAGMQAHGFLGGDDEALAVQAWLSARDAMVMHVEQLEKIGVHKQITNRLLEPFLWHTCIITSTEWDNLFKLRTHKDAQPEFQTIAKMLKEAYDGSVPIKREYHLPLVIGYDQTEEERGGRWVPTVLNLPESRALRELQRGLGETTVNDLMKISAARCARVSYLTHEGVRDPQEDLKLYDRLVTRQDPSEPIHSSPTEHPATAQTYDTGPRWSGNFYGWDQFRKGIPHESGTDRPTREQAEQDLWNQIGLYWRRGNSLAF